jgi:hypothetical protein
MLICQLWSARGRRARPPLSSAKLARPVAFIAEFVAPRPETPGQAVQAVLVSEAAGALDRAGTNERPIFVHKDKPRTHAAGRAASEAVRSGRYPSAFTVLWSARDQT